MTSPLKDTRETPSPRSSVPLWGLLKPDGVWHCNCQPKRMPAVKRQTKNYGVHHGRWCKFSHYSLHDTPLEAAHYLADRLQSTPARCPNHSSATSSCGKATPKSVRSTPCCPTHPPNVHHQLNLPLLLRKHPFRHTLARAESTAASSPHRPTARATTTPLPWPARAWRRPPRAPKRA